MESEGEGTLPHKTVVTLEAVKDVHLVVAGAYLAHFVSTLGGDVKLVTRTPRSFTTFVYFFARLASWVLVAGSLIFHGAPYPTCLAGIRMGAVANPLVIISSTYLFYVRAQAIYLHTRRSRFFFTAIWLANAGVSVGVASGVRGAQLGTSGVCDAALVRPFSSAMYWVLAAHDTVLFCAISARLVAQEEGEGASALKVVRVVFSWVPAPHGLPEVSRMLFRGGQQYYFCVVAFNIATATVLLIMDLPPFVRVLLPPIDILFTQVMASVVYRQTLLDTIPSGQGTRADASPPERSASTLEFRTSVSRVASPLPV